MQPIDVRPQTRLSTARIFGLCLKGIRHRIFRSLLTTMVIVLAVAFFMYLLADSVIVRAVGAGITAEVHEARRPALAIEHWFGRPSAATLAQRLAQPDAPLAGYAAVAGWEPEELSALAGRCAIEHALIAWLGEIDSGSRAMLVRGAEDADILAWLGDPERWSEFAAGAPRVRRPVMPIALASVADVVRAAPMTAASLARLSGDWSRRIDGLGSDLADLTGSSDPDGCVDWLVAGGRERSDAFHVRIARHGFGGLWPIAGMDGLQRSLRAMRQRDAIAAALMSEGGRQRWRELFRSEQPLDEKLARLDDPRAGEALGGRFSAEVLAETAEAVRTDRRLAAREQAIAGRYDASGGLVTARQAFLLAISFVVCMVGIANAMLMAITERFREIATMKCLGATDGFILTQFLMEAGIQGAAGGIAGMAAGLLFALVKDGWMFGTHLLWYMPWLGLAGAAGACVLAGLLLATLASVYPSWMASRMAPMEAMRIE